MPANTPGGLPYPLPTEPVRDGAVAIRNLAAVEGKIGVGSGNFQAGQIVATTNAFGAMVITPPKPFTAAFPVVLAGFADASNTGMIVAGSRYVSGETFITLFIWQLPATLLANTAVRINWMAVG